MFNFAGAALHTVTVFVLILNDVKTVWACVLYLTYQWYVLGLLNANYFDSLASPLSYCFSLGRQRLRLHFSLCYTVMGQEQGLQKIQTQLIYH